MSGVPRLEHWFNNQEEQAMGGTGKGKLHTTGWPLPPEHWHIHGYRLCLGNQSSTWYQHNKVWQGTDQGFSVWQSPLQKTITQDGNTDQRARKKLTGIQSGKVGFACCLA